MENQKSAIVIKAIANQDHHGVIQRFSTVVGLSRSTLSRILSGERKLTVDQVDKILRGIKPKHRVRFLKSVVSDWWGAEFSKLVSS